MALTIAESCSIAFLLERVVPRGGGRSEKTCLRSHGVRKPGFRFARLQLAIQTGERLHISFLRHVKAAPASQQRQWLKFIQPCWEAVWAALVMLEVPISLDDVESVRRWVTVSTVGCGPGFVAKCFKAFANRARSLAAAIGGPVPAAVRHFSSPPPLHPGSPPAFARILRKIRRSRPGAARARELCQLSSLSRALPPANDEVCSKALEDHRVTLSKKVVTPPSTITELRRFAESWGKRYGRFANTSVASLSASSSASLDYSRRLGGLRADLRDTVDTWMREPAGKASDGAHPAPTFSDPTRFTRTGEANRNLIESSGSLPERGSVEYVVNILQDPDLERTRIARILRDSSLRKFVSRKGPLPCRATTVRERGWKARVVTKSPSDVVEVGHLVRSVVWPMLEKDPRVRASLEGGRLEEVFADLASSRLKCPISLGNLVLVSADLTKATDGFSRLSIYAVWEGICDGAQLPEDVRALGLRLLGPMRVEYDDGLEVLDTEGGCLMGLPLSWFILNIINLWACETSIREACHKIGLPVGASSDLYRFATCGDDLAAALPAAAHEGYERRIADVGSGLSAGKHLVSNHLMLFTEQMAWFETDVFPAPDYTLFAWLKPGTAVPDGFVAGYNAFVAAHMIDYSPVRSLIHPGHFATKRVSGPIPFELPSWATSGPAITSAIPAWASVLNRKKISRIARVLRPEVGALRSVGIPPYVPRELGGGGFPPPRPGRALKDAPDSYRRFLFRILLDHQSGKEEKAVSAIRRVVNSWRTCGVAGDLLSEAMTEAEEELKLKPLWESPQSGSLAERLSTTLEDHLTLTEDDAMLRLASVWAPALGIAGYNQGRPYCTPFYTFAGKFRKMVQSGASTVTGRGKPMRDVDESVVADRLKEMCSGPVVFIPKDRIPPGLGVCIVGMPSRRRKAGLHRQSRSSRMDQVVGSNVVRNRSGSPSDRETGRGDFGGAAYL